MVCAKSDDFIPVKCSDETMGAQHMHHVYSKKAGSKVHDLSLRLTKSPKCNELCAQRSHSLTFRLRKIIYGAPTGGQLPALQQGNLEALCWLASQKFQTAATCRRV
jgi:hypothetical protein